MKKKNFYSTIRSSIQKIWLSLLLTGFCAAGFAQNKLSDLIKGENGVSKQFTTLSADQQVRYNASQLDNLLGLDKNSKLVLIKAEPDQLGEIHYRYYQSYLGRKVENSMFIVHTKNGTITGMTGTIVTAFDARMSSRSASVYDKKEAILLAIKSVHAKKYMWENPVKEQALKKRANKQDATYYPQASLVWYSPGGEIKPGTLRLAYKVDVYAEQPLSRANIYIDAQTGTFLGSASLLCYTDATGTANTTYSGTQTIHSNFLFGVYNLWDITRGNGIRTLQGESFNYGGFYQSPTANWSLSGNDQAALDVHWGVASTYDFYLSNFNRNSIDNNGYALYSYVNEFDSGAINNAYWDGDDMHFGRLSSNNASITAIDVTGHELTHGLTQFTSGLVYDNEPGAINESMSDIMGKSVQFWAKPTDINWQISNDMGWLIRNMSNPNASSQPDTYLGTNWYTTAGCTPSQYNDYCGIHTNSGVGNYMYYLLVNGGSGTNDIGNAFSVTGIGLAKAQQIIYRSETVYLTPNSNYPDWRTACLQAVGDLYGTCSNEAVQTANAWYAVGVGNPAPPLTLNLCAAIPAGDYAASASITSCLGDNAKVTSAAATTFTANDISFLPGFEAREGCNFRAYITPCSITSFNSKPAAPNYVNAFTSFESVVQNLKTKEGEFAALVYPNPSQTTASLQLTGTRGVVFVTLTNVQGKVLWKNQSRDGRNTQLPVAGLPAGLYLVTVKDDIHFKTLKLIKQ